jgi:hypothetical protein
MPSLLIASLFPETPVMRVVGASGGFPRPVPSLLYSYFLKNYAGSYPEREVFDEQNEPFQPGSKAHVFFVREKMAASHKPGKRYIDNVDAYIAQIHVEKKRMAETFNDLFTIEEELKRIFIVNYPSYGMAGIRQIDHMEGTGYSGPESPNNPFKETWMLSVRFLVYYYIEETARVLTNINQFELSAGQIMD